MAQRQTIVRATYSQREGRIVLASSERSPEWMAIWEACHRLSDDIQVFSIIELSVPVWVLFRLGDTLVAQSRTGNLDFEPDAGAEQLLRAALRKRQELDAPLAELPALELERALDKISFRRKLTAEQLRNVAHLLRFSSAADFSVPGAGKTTEALAFFALKRDPSDHLVVVAPINAFAPWEEQIELCFGPSRFRVVRLTGTADSIAEILRSAPDIALINYHKLAQTPTRRVVAQYVANNAQFLFLDESHKIKRGENGAWGSAVLSIAHLPTYKLVMSGTPLPNSEADLVAQLQFLHPEADVDESNATSLIQPIFVRTTKAELHLPGVTRRLIELPLTTGQRRLYDLLSSALARDAEDALSRRERGAVRRLGRGVLRLIKFVSNPALLIPDIQQSEAPTLGDILLDEESRKLEYAVLRARSLAKEGRKCIIWSSFVDNVEVLAERLADIGADFIHGGVDVGSEEEDTRERKIKLFHEDNNRFVLIANPAAAGESISLHTVCHNAIYLDRTYNAAQFLQSEDRIHRVGLPPGTRTEIELLVAPGTIDESVNRRLSHKVRVMGEVLNDPHLRIDLNYEDPDDDSAIADADLADFLESVKAAVP
jgi:hypothetical protein